MQDDPAIKNKRNKIVSPATVKGFPFLGVTHSLRRDALGFFTRALRHYGDRVQLRVLGGNVLLLGHPADMEAVLIHDRGSYGRSREVRNLRPIFGNGLLASDGELWLRQRRLIQPKFSHSAIQEYANVMIERITAQTAEWRPGEIRSFKVEMMEFTRDVVCQTLFGRERSSDAQKVAEAVTIVFGDVRSETLYLPIWRWLPLARSRRWNHAVRVLNHTIKQMIAERRRSGKVYTDLLGLLLSASDEDGSVMSDQQVHDEVLTMFLAGHEPSALLLSWAAALLAAHPETQEAAAVEVQAVLDNEPLCAKHLPQFRLLNAVVHETLRLYPAVWSIGRSVMSDTMLGDLPVKRGTHVWLCIYTLQHDERWFPEPERFHPQRWLGDAVQKRHTFLPFGAGPRMCIGQHFAMTETILGLSAILARFRLLPTEENIPKMDAWITLRPRGGVPIRLEQRSMHA
jgi:cytochrome P450